MADYSLSVNDDSDLSNTDLQSFLKLPFVDDAAEDNVNTTEDKYLIKTTDGQLVWVSYSLDSTPAVCDTPPAVFVLHSKEQPFLLSQEDGNILTVSSFENFSICEDEVVEDDDINTDDILKVEDRVKVFDAILAPLEKKVKAKTRVGVENDSKLGNYICDLCGSSFTRAVQYYGHLHLHSGEFMWECQLCPAGSSQFTSQSLLRRHEKRYHVNLRPHTCAECGASFDRPSQLDYHKRRIHDGERPHGCQLCGKAFFKRSDLRTHLNTHLSVHGCMCEICGRRFSHVSNLTRHMRIHSGIKPYPCSVCGRRFNQLKSLNEHKASHMNRIPVSCCDKIFKTQLMLRKHLKSVHQATGLVTQRTIGNKRRFHCKVCGDSFPFLTLLRKHEMTHDQFTCSSCKKESNSLEELKNHSCNKEETDSGDFICDRELNERLDDMYLDANTDWIDPQSLVQSDIGELNDPDSLRVEGFTCDNLDPTKSLCYTAAEVDKLVEETCCQVSSGDVSVVDRDCLEIDSLITPFPSVSSSPPSDSTSVLIAREVSIMTPQHSSDSLDHQICDSFNTSVVFDPSIPISGPGDDSLGGYSIVDECADIIDKSDHCVNGKISEEDGNLNSGSIFDDVNIKTENYLDNSECARPAVDNENDNHIDLCGDNDKNKMENLHCFIDKQIVELYGPFEINDSNNNISNNDNNISNNDNNDSISICHNNNNNSEDNVSSDNSDKTEEVNKCPIKQDTKDKLPKKYTCSVCGKEFQKASNFRQHEGIHDIGRQLHRCKVCGRSFAWKTTLNKHALTHSENPNPPLFPCSTCDKLYASSSLLQAHINRDHLKQRPHSCSLCKKSFFKKYDLKIHLRTHTNERPYICGFCGRRFGHVSHLIRHERIHSGQRPYQCSYCAASFIQSSSLAAHQKHHVKEQNNKTENSQPAVWYPVSELNA